MKISIAERFRPFCHLPGTMCLLPFSKLRFQIFPAHIIVSDMSIADPVRIADIPLDLEGPVKQFTVLQDLEKGCIKVWGFSKKGFFRYRIHAIAASPGFVIVQEKSPSDEYIPKAYCKKHSYLEMPSIEQLSFGVTKVADWELVARRFLLSEILPFWFRLGQLIPAIDLHDSGTASLLNEIKKCLSQKNVLGLSQAFKNLYEVGFEGLLSCLLKDQYYKGVALPEVLPNSLSSPLLLLTEGAKLIKQMLLSLVQKPDSNETIVEILPCLMPELHSGRLCQVNLENIGSIDLEWSKKKIRRMLFRSNKSQIVSFHFQNDVNSFRLRESTSEVVTNQECGESISFSANSIYFFDHFQH